MSEIVINYTPEGEEPPQHALRKAYAYYATHPSMPYERRQRLCDGFYQQINPEHRTILPATLDTPLDDLAAVIDEGEEFALRSQPPEYAAMTLSTIILAVGTDYYPSQKIEAAQELLSQLELDETQPNIQGFQEYFVAELVQSLRELSENPQENAAAIASAVRGLSATRLATRAVVELLKDDPLCYRSYFAASMLFGVRELFDSASTPDPRVEELAKLTLKLDW